MQRLGRTRDAPPGQRSSDQSSRGRTRAASQADVRQVKPEDESNMSDVDYEVESKRSSALRRRMDPGPLASTRGMDGTGTDADDTSCDHEWSKDVVDMDHLTDASRSGRAWGDDWRQHISGSPERSPRQLVNPSTPISGQSSDLSSTSPGSTTSDATSMTATPQHSDIFHCSPGKLGDDISDSSHDSPMSIHASPVSAAVAAVQAAQVSSNDHGLSLAAAVDPSASWPSSSQSDAQRTFEPFAWNGPDPEPEAPWSEPAPAAPSQSHPEDFGFIDLFAENWEPSEAPPAEAPTDDGRLEAFMKEAEAAGVFGVEEYFLPRGNGGSYGNAAVA